MVKVTEQEEEALTLLDDGGDYGDVLSEYDNGAEMIESLDEKNLLASNEDSVKAGISERARRYLRNGDDESSWENSFPGLNENEAWTLYGTLAGASRSDIADFLDVSNPAVSNYRNTLVDQNYLRNLQPGRGPSDYIPGGEMIDRMNHYSSTPRLIEDIDPGRPLEEDEEVRWLIGEELYEKLNSEVQEVKEESQEESSVIKPELNGHAEEDAVKFLKLVESGEAGFGVIADAVEDGYSMADTLEDQNLIEDDREAFSGIELTDKGAKYLANTDIDVQSTDNSSSQSNRSSRSRNSKSTSTSSTESVADRSLQRIGDELLGDHEETLEQQDERKRDFTDEEETAEVDIEDDNAGYEGFT